MNTLLSHQSSRHDFVHQVVGDNGSSIGANVFTWARDEDRSGSKQLRIAASAITSDSLLGKIYSSNEQTSNAAIETVMGQDVLAQNGATFAYAPNAPQEVVSAMHRSAAEFVLRLNIEGK